MSDPTLTEALRRSVKELQRLRAENAALLADSREPIAVLGAACRLPGGIANPDDLWELLERGQDATGDLPADRGWDLDALYDPEGARPGSCYSRRGGFLDAAGDFDAAFFGISAREALSLDPQQRLLLETGWEALEAAGIVPESLRESATGVYVGVLHQDYVPGLHEVPDELSGYAMTGGLNSLASGRISYALGLNGPALTVETACSSSLVAVHLAVKALRAGECELALAGGATVMATPGMLAAFSRQRGLARDGRCKPFAAQADGIGLAEGAGMVVLAKLSYARRIGAPVLGLIRGSAVNQDGTTNGVTAPSGPAQQQVIRAALRDAGLAAETVDALEAHGTGTALGDPVEAEAVLAVYGADRPADRPLRLGSLKSNLGHTCAAAGVAGLIKMLLALRAGTLPKTLHAGSPSEHVDWTAGHVSLLTEACAWPAAGPEARPRRAAVSSFGMSGTNAHVIVEQAPVDQPRPAPSQSSAQSSAALLFPLAAKTPASLRAQAARLRGFLDARPEIHLPDVAYSLGSTRTAFDERAVVITQDRAQLLEALDAVCADLEAGRALPQDPDSAVVTAARRFLNGHTPDWEELFAEHAPRRIALPTYAFDRTRFWWHRPGPTVPAAPAAPAARPEPPAAAVDISTLIRAHLAEIVGHEDPAGFDQDTTFLGLGLTSVGVLELHRGLMAATGLSLPPTIVFDHPTPRDLARFLHANLGSAGPDRPTPAAAAKTEDGFDADAIAIVGMACRLPGGVRGPADLWRVVSEGVDATSAFPEDRGWDLDRLHDADPDQPGTTYVRRGGFVEDVAGFDAQFFAVNPREALAMDPQQRLLLELAWEAAEHARIDPTRLRGSDTGTFIGLAMQDYRARSADPRDAADLEAYGATGQAVSIASGRIAYTLGLQGPAITVDTACSASLVSLHLACRSLREGECSAALVGGSTVYCTPEAFVQFSRHRGLAPDGRCKPFAAEADGTIWADGAAMLLLERAADARRLGHRILALVRGTAVNSDGASNGLTAPNGAAQQRVLRAALADAGLTGAEVDLLEAHGTGTRLGDPVEAQALLAVYGAGRPADRPLRLGSLKSNLGHTGAAAGIAGVIKSVLALDHGVLPKTLHAERPTDHVDWSSGAVRLLQQELPWPPTAAGHPRRAAVSAFGMSGTNAHAILEQAPDVPEPAATRAPAGLVACPLSATSDAALRAQATRLLEHLEQHRELGVAEVGWSLATTRAALRRRAVVFARDRADLLVGLRTVVGGQSAPIPDVADSSEADAIALGTAYCGGEEVDWTKAFEPGLGCVDLPTYAFQHHRFWPEPASRAAARPAATPEPVPAPAPAPVRALPPVPVPTPVQAPPPHTEPSAAVDIGSGADELLERILDAASDLLGLPADEIDPDDGFFQLGLDSVLAMRLRAVLEEITGASVSVTVLFDQPTARELAEHLARRSAEQTAATLPGPQTAPPLPRQPQPPPPESLTEDDLLLLLTTEIEAAQAARTRGGSRP